MKITYTKYLTDSDTDVILWFQLLDFASAEKKSIIFVTDDVKEDWWLSPTHSHSPIKPHPELVQEMYLKAGVSFYMYEGYKFVENAQRFLQLENQPAIIDEIKAVGQFTSKKEEIQTAVDMFEAVKTTDLKAWIEQMEALNVPNVGAMFERILEDSVKPDTLATTDFLNVQAMFKKLEFLNFSNIREILDKLEHLDIQNMRTLFEALGLPSTRAELETLNLPNINLPDMQAALEAFDTPVMRAVLEGANIPTMETVLEAGITLSKLSSSAKVIEAGDPIGTNNNEENRKDSD